jgi:hypothetical protein
MAIAVENVGILWKCQVVRTRRWWRLGREKCLGERKASSLAHEIADMCMATDIFPDERGDRAIQQHGTQKSTCPQKHQQVDWFQVLEYFCEDIEGDFNERSAGIFCRRSIWL